MKKILIPTDFSQCAQNATETGFELALRLNSDIHFIHILRTPVDWKHLRKEQEKNFPETLHDIGVAKGELTKLENFGKKINVNTKCTLIYDNGSLYHNLKNKACDFIIMGSHGANGFKEVFGSNTQEVVRHSKIPVLIVKSITLTTSIKNIVFASTWEDDIQVQLEQVITFSKKIAANLHLLYVNLPNESKTIPEIESIMKANMMVFKNVNYTMNVYDSINEEQGIVQFAETIDADLITMITHGKSGFKQLISPSITESLVNHSSIPILSLNSEK
jgi:nucleotide-binding universal stress UspA family protein